MMGHARSTLVDQVYAHSMQSGMASVASAVTAHVLGEQPKLRIIERGQQDGTLRAIRHRISLRPR
jgi:alpha-D-ribose 1-methylphosphonate 5-phosphate C-P lyase